MGLEKSHDIATITERIKANEIQPFLYTHLVAHSFIHSLTSSLIHSLPNSLIRLLFYSLSHSFIHSLTPSLSHVRTCSFTQPPNHFCTDSMNTSLSKLQAMVKNRGAWRAAVRGVAKSQTRLSDWTTTKYTKNTVSEVGLWMKGQNDNRCASVCMFSCSAWSSLTLSSLNQVNSLMPLGRKLSSSECRVA